jgi:hypothetical protein
LLFSGRFCRDGFFQQRCFFLFSLRCMGEHGSIVSLF